jgi:spermidine/putrescine-binding protein
MCVGNTIKTNVLYNGEPFGDEVHSVIGVSQNKTVNVSEVTRVFAKLGEITFNDSQARIDNLNFSLRTTDSNGTVSTLETGETPLYMMINGSADRRWFWSAEGVNIGVAYPQFSSWASDMHSNLRWYDASNAVSTKVVSWTLSDE